MPERATCDDLCCKLFEGRRLLRWGSFRLRLGCIMVCRAILSAPMEARRGSEKLWKRDIWRAADQEVSCAASVYLGLLVTFYVWGMDGGRLRACAPPRIGHTVN